MQITNPTRSEPCANVPARKEGNLGLHAVCSMRSAFDQSVEPVTTSVGTSTVLPPRVRVWDPSEYVPRWVHKPVLTPPEPMHAGMQVCYSASNHHNRRRDSKSLDP